MKNPNKVDLLREFSQKVADKGKLFEALIELTHRCNLRCIHCYIPQENPPPEASVEDWKKAIDKLVENGLCVITFTGGEPLLYEDLIQLISYGFRKGCQTRIFSNANLLNCMEKILEFKKAGLCQLETSIYGATARTHDKITGINGSFEKTIQAIRLCGKAGIPVTVKTSWLSLNWHEYKQVIEFVKKLGVFFRGSPNVTPRNDGNRKNLSSQMSYEELVEFYRLEQSMFPRSKIQKNNILGHGKPPCGVARLSIAIAPDGKIFPCMHIRESIGNIHQDDFTEIWKNAPMLKKLRAITLDDFNSCNDCEYRSYCFICMGDFWIENGEFLKPSKTTCIMARARYTASKRNNDS